MKFAAEQVAILVCYSLLAGGFIGWLFGPNVSTEKARLKVFQLFVFVLAIGSCLLGWYHATLVFVGAVAVFSLIIDV